MRITGGQLVRRQFDAPRGLKTRPTPDRVRESLFSHLSAAHLEQGFEDLQILDLFAGSGGLSLEALSRGAAHATLIDSDHSALRAIRKNLDALNLVARARVREGSLPGVLRHLEGSFDLVFADPPYDRGALPPLLLHLERPGLLAPGALVVLEHRQGDAPLPGPAWTHHGERRFGESSLTFLRPSSSVPQRQ